MDIEKALPGIKENISLAKHTTFKIGGRAKYFYVAREKEDLIKAVEMAKKFNVPFLVLGGGSNILISDKGFNGLVVKIQNNRFEFSNSEIFSEAGVKLDDLAKLAAKRSLAGLEWAAGIPGTVGGAIYGNAQAFGSRMSKIVKKVEVFDVKNQRLKNLSRNQCGFSLKNSIFKRRKNLIIISALLKLKKGKKKEIQEKLREYLDYRKKRHPLNLPSAGSIFVNNEKLENRRLLKEFPELKKFKKRKTIPVAYLIEKCGLKGKRIGEAKISEVHANFIVNLGGARAGEVISLIKLIKQKVKKKFRISLKEEVQIIE